MLGARERRAEPPEITSANPATGERVDTLSAPEPWLGSGLEVLALPSPTLPPATTTNTVLLGARSLWVIDPAPPGAEGRARLAAAVDARRRAGAVPRGILLTHHHRDHVGAAAWLRETCGLPLWAHVETARLLAPGLTVDHLLADGDPLPGDDEPEARDRWVALHTPGHAPGHLTFWQPESRRLVVGDMVASVGTILVAPPEGHMATYLDQLLRLANLGPRVLVPAHGPPFVAPGAAEAVLRATHAHRLEREARVAAVLGREPASLGAITAGSYTDVPRALHPLASGSAHAHLIKLAEDGRALRDPDGRWRVP